MDSACFKYLAKEMGLMGECHVGLAAIADGTAPADLTVTGLAKALPYSWAEQERAILAKHLVPMIAGPEGSPVIRYATVRGLSRLAGAEPHA
jgi:hypothetical protein